MKVLGKQEKAAQEVRDTSKEKNVLVRLTIACTVTYVFAFVLGAAFTNVVGTNTQLTTITNTSDEAMQIYYLNQDAINRCQQKNKSKSEVIDCPFNLVVPSK